MRAMWSRMDNPARGLVVLLAGYAAIGLVFAYIDRDVINPDGVSYLTLANEYRHGHWDNAVNGYWGPLLSWLLAPFLVLGIEPLLAFRLLNWGIGGLTIIGVWKLASQFALQRSWRLTVTAIASLLILSWTVLVVTPDLLIVCLLMPLFFLFLSDDLAVSVRNSMLCGILGGLLYLAKPFGLVFFIIAFPLSVLISGYARGMRRRIPRVTITVGLAGYAAFAILIVPWIVLLHHKYDAWTISTSSAYNLALKSPRYTDRWPLFSEPGLFPPSFKGAASVWVDPSFIPFERWNPLASLDDIEHFIVNIIANLVRSAGAIGVASTLVLGVAIVCMGVRSIINVEKSIVVGTCLSVIYIGLYCLVLVEVRYMWPIVILSLVIGASLASALYRTHAPGKMTGGILAIAMVLLIVLAPMWKPGGGSRFYGLPTLWVSHDEESEAQALRAAADQMRDTWVPGNVASNDIWEESFSLAYFLDAPYYGYPVLEGEPAGGSETAAIQELLDANDITWFWLWDTGEEVPAYLADFDFVESAIDDRLKIYHRHA